MVQGIAFLSKKSWHTKNLANQEKVWIAEQRKAQEESKTKELARQITLEREREELDRLAGKKTHLDRGIDWMYQGQAATGGADSKPSALEQEDADNRAEAFLLGKDISGEAGAAHGDFAAASGAAEGVNAVVKLEDPINVASAASAAAASGPPGETSVADRNEAFRQRVEDPMFMVSQREREKKTEVSKQKALYERVMGPIGDDDDNEENDSRRDKKKKSSRKKERKERRRREKDDRKRKRRDDEDRHERKRHRRREDSDDDSEENRLDRRHSRKRDKYYSSDEDDSDRRQHHSSSRRRRSRSREKEEDRKSRHSSSSRRHRSRSRSPGESSRHRHHHSDHHHNRSDRIREHDNRKSHHRDRDDYNRRDESRRREEQHRHTHSDAPQRKEAPPKKAGYGLQGKSTSSSISKSPGDLGPAQDLLRKKRQSVEEERRRAKDRAGSRRAMTSEERAQALQEMQATAKARSEKDTSRKVLTDDGEDTPKTGKARFITDLTERAHGLKGNAQSLTSRMQQNRNTQQRLHDDSFL